MSAKKITAKQKPAKRRPMEWNAYAVVGTGGKLERAFRTKEKASLWAMLPEKIIRVRITEIVK